MVYIGAKIHVFDTQGGTILTSSKSRIYKNDPDKPNAMILGSIYSN